MDYAATQNLLRAAAASSVAARADVVGQPQQRRHALRRVPSQLRLGRRYELRRNLLSCKLSLTTTSLPTSQDAAQSVPGKPALYQGEALQVSGA